MKGYHGRPDETAEVIDSDGWFDTGDLGMLTPYGELVITGRVREMIVLLGGENVHPQPLERRILESPLVAQVMVVGHGARVLGALVVPDAVSDAPPLQMAIATVTSGLIGAVTFFGSLVAFTKLADFKWAKDVRFKGQQILNAVLFLVALLVAAQVVRDPSALGWYWGLVGVAALLFDKVDLKGRKVAVVISGGNIDIDLLFEIVQHGLRKQSGR